MGKKAVVASEIVGDKEGKALVGKSVGVEVPNELNRNKKHENDKDERE